MLEKVLEKMLEHRIFRNPELGEPKVLAVFSYRYDAHLVPDLIENIRSAVHGYIAWDDRDAGEALSDEPARRNALLAEARRLGADWILAVDPDERFEDRLAQRMPEMLAMGLQNIWIFDVREMFDLYRYRTDGLWGTKRMPRLFPAAAGVVDPTFALHGFWVAADRPLKARLARINLYHLRMASPVRRRLRRELYAAADPARVFQKLGYDYLDDERGMALEKIDPARSFSPSLVEDHGLWAPDPGKIGEVRPDPYEARIFRVGASARQCGHLSAHQVLEDLRQDSPEDSDLSAVSARLAGMAGDWRTALGLVDNTLSRRPGDLHARLLRVSVLLNLRRHQEAAEALLVLRDVAPAGPVIEALNAEVIRSTADFAAPGAQWRRWVTGSAGCRDGGNIAKAEMVVVVIGFRAQEELLAAVRSLLDQDEAAEIVVVNTGGGAVERILVPVLERIRLITVETPMYVGAARNIGVDASRAPWVAFLAGDCTARARWVSGRMSRHRAGALSVATAVIDESDCTLTGQAANRLRYSSRSVLTMAQDVSFYGQSYARWLLTAVGAFPVGLAVSEDSAVNALASRISAPVWAPEVQTCHREQGDLRSLVRDERVRGARRADHQPFRVLVGEADHALAIAPAMDSRLAAAWRLVDLDPGLSSRERRAVKAMQWLASLADRKGLSDAMMRLAAADAAFARAEMLADGDPVKALQDALEATRLDPQSWKNPHLAGRIYADLGDTRSAERMLSRVVALSPGQAAAVISLTRLIADRDGPVAALRFAEDAALAAPTERRLWSNAAEMAVAAACPSWAVALGLIGLALAFDRPDTHQRIAAWHSANDDPMAAAFRSLTAARLKKCLALQN